jgi:Family of unknown function (DUF6058)
VCGAGRTRTRMTAGGGHTSRPASLIALVTRPRKTPSGRSTRSVTPETIARKDRLVTDIEAMLADPRPREPDWRDALRAAIDALDALERPFAPLDEHRFGNRPTRHRLIEDPRERWPWLAA